MPHDRTLSPHDRTLSHHDRTLNRRDDCTGDAPATIARVADQFGVHRQGAVHRTRRKPLSRRASFWTAAAVAGVSLWSSAAPTTTYPLYASAGTSPQRRRPRSSRCTRSSSWCSCWCSGRSRTTSAAARRCSKIKLVGDVDDDLAAATALLERLVAGARLRQG